MRKPNKSTLTYFAIGAALLGAYFIFGGGTPDPSPTPAPGPTPTPGPGPAPPPVDHVLQTSGGLMNTRQAQIMLKTLGGPAGSAVMSGLTVDGIWGLNTQAAAMQYRSIKGSPGGELDPGMAQTLAADYNQYINQGGVPAT